MATQITTSTASGDATATPAGQSVAIAPSDNSLMAIYFGTSGPELATAQPPYTTWAKQGIGAASTRNSQALLGRAGNDGLDIIVTSPSNGPFYFTAARSVNTWTLTAVGSTLDPNNAAGVTGASMMMALDPQGRIWYVGLDDVLATYQPNGADWNGSAWTIDTTLEATNLGENNHRGVAAAIIGGFLVVVYDSGAGGLSYRRRDVSGAVLGAWSVAAALPGLGNIVVASTLSLRTIPGSSTGILAFDDSVGVHAMTYNATNDTWSGVTTLDNNSNSGQPALIPGAAGVMYAVWTHFLAVNSWSIVAKGLHSGVWDASFTTLEAAANISWPNGVYLPGGKTLAIIWTLGGASPWSIMFDNVSAPPDPVPPSAGGEALPYFPHRRFIHPL